jgi:hypothetical protein
MLISFSHHFIFIHVSKSAGTSIQHALQSYAHRPQQTPLNRLSGKMRIPRDPRQIAFPQHITARSVEALLPEEVFIGFFKFAVVRNPWDWIVSLYHYLRETPSHRHHARVCGMSSLEEYITFEAARKKRTQHGFISGDDGRVLVDFVGRYEFLDEDFTRVCSFLGISATLPHLNATPRQDYREYFTPATIELVEEFWQDDIRLFGYTFDAPPGKPPIDKTAEFLRAPENEAPAPGS